MATANTSRKPASYEHFLDQDDGSGRTLRLGLFAAVVIHLVVFAITWPTFARTEVLKGTRIIAYKLQPVKFIEPPPPEQRFTVPPRRIHIPDPDPLGPEPINRTVPETVPVEYPEEVLPFFPEAPPTAEETDSPTILKAGIDIDPPKALHRIQPQYTEAARRIRFEGAVVLSLLIDTDGRVTDINVLSGIPFGLTENAVAAVQQWLFEPCTYNGNPVSVRMILTVHFRIAS
jgi:TonB family protein